MKFFTKTLAAGAATIVSWPGKVLSMKTCTLPINVAFDGGGSDQVSAGQVIPNETEFKNVNFVNNNSISVTFSFYIGDEAAPFAPGDNSQTINQTYILANGGSPTIPAIPVAKITSGATWSTTLGALVDLNVSTALYISGVNNGHRRKQIVFQNTTLNGNGNDVIILDPNGLPFLRIPANDVPYVFETSADFYVCGIGNAVVQGAFIYNEFYYATNA